MIVEVDPQVAAVKSASLDRPGLGGDGSGSSWVVGHFGHGLRPGHGFFWLLRREGVVSLAILEDCRVGAIIMLLRRIGREYFLV